MSSLETNAMKAEIEMQMWIDFLVSGGDPRVATTEWFE